MKILPARTNLNPNIKYRRMLNKLNLEIRAKIADEEMFYPHETMEKQKIMQTIEGWKKEQQARIYNECYNPKSSIFSKIFSFFK